MGALTRIFVSAEQIGKREVRFDKATGHHVRNVLRLQVGDMFLVTDGSGWEYLAELGPAGGRILERSSPPRESPLEIILAQAVPKSDIMSQIIQKGVELGVSEIWPLRTSRTVAALRGLRQTQRWKRWQRIVEGAVAQSGRTRLPALLETQTWEQFLERPDAADLKLLLWERENRGLKEVLDGEPAPSRIFLAVGPEGGWDDEEVAAARRAGFETAGFGPRTLRSGTAGVAALGVLQYLFGDLGRSAV